jgi:hypothetical protein
MALTSNDARIIFGMVARGDKHHDVASWFGENPARVAEVLSGEAFGILPAAPANELPPKGAPGLKGRKLMAFVEKALAQFEAGNTAEGIETLKAGVKRYNLNEG